MCLDQTLSIREAGRPVNGPVSNPVIVAENKRRSRRHRCASNPAGPGNGFHQSVIIFVTGDIPGPAARDPDFHNRIPVGIFVIN